MQLLLDLLPRPRDEYWPNGLVPKTSQAARRFKLVPRIRAFNMQLLRLVVGSVVLDLA